GGAGNVEEAGAPAVGAVRLELGDEVWAVGVNDRAASEVGVAAGVAVHGQTIVCADRQALQGDVVGRRVRALPDKLSLGVEGGEQADVLVADDRRTAEVERAVAGADDNDRAVGLDLEVVDPLLA